MNPEEQQLILSHLPPGHAQKRLALGVVLGSLAVYLIIALPLSGIDKPYPSASFIPAYFTASFVIQLITAILLFAQFSTLRTRATLLIASGYVFGALMLISIAMALPGVFVSKTPIGNLQSSIWLFFASRAGFALFVIGYALLKDAAPAKRFHKGTVGVPIAVSATAAAALACVVTYVCTADEFPLPRVMLDSYHAGPLLPFAAVPVALVCFLAMILLWRRLSSVLDLWLIVVMCLIEVQLLNYYVDSVRYGIGWYTIRTIGLLGNSVVLIVLLYEIETLYARVLAAVLGQQREREARLATGDAVAASIAHEVRQPLTAMVTNADAGLRFLDRSTPNLERAKEAFKRIATDGHRAGAVVESIRSNFRNDDRTLAPLDVNELIREVLALEGNDLQKHDILVQAESSRQVQEVLGNRVQLRQVLLNLIANAIDAMAASDGPRVLILKSDVHEGAGVKISVVDTGAGISSQDFDRIFTPLFTTKSSGMGMGLSICRAIIEAHHGRLWATPNTPRGAVFQFTLQSSSATLAGAPR